MRAIYRIAVGYRTLLCRPMIIVLLLVNVIGAVGYLVLVASLHVWAMPEDPVSAGQEFVWGLFALPVYLVYTLINTAWGVVILARRQWRSGGLWLFVMSIWLLAIAIDFAHH
jgi:hypothetical protein